MTELDVEVVASTEDIQTMVQRYGDVRAIHVEITGENPHQGEVLGIAFDGEDFVCYCPLELCLSKTKQSPYVNGWQTADVPKTLYDAHKVRLALAWQGIELRGVHSILLGCLCF